MTIELVKHISEATDKAIAYIYLAEYALFEYHIDNGVDFETYNLNNTDTGKFLSEIYRYYKKYNVESIMYKEDDNYIGFIAYRTYDNGIYIVSLYVDPSARGKGIAKKLMSEVIKSGKMQYKVLVGDFNKHAIKMYESFGFNKVDKYVENANGMHEYVLNMEN